MSFGKCLFPAICSFIVLAAVRAEATVLVHDNFNRPDGGLHDQVPTPGPGDAWNAGAGGGINPVQVVGGEAVVVHTVAINGEDIANNFGDQTATATTFARFDFRLPGADNANLDPGVGLEGVYFVTLRDTSAMTTLRARTGVLAPIGDGDFRLAINADSSDLSLGAIWPDELSFDTTYRAVITYDAALGESKLWVDPVNEASLSVMDSGTASTVIDRFSLRQHNTYEGKQIVDNLVVATTFAEALNPPALGLPGDYNGDTLVDAADYTVWRNNLGTNFDLNGNGDETGDSLGFVDEADYVYWAANYGAPNPGGGGASFTVPEPAAATILWMGLALAAVPRRIHSLILVRPTV